MNLFCGTINRNLTHRFHPIDDDSVDRNDRISSLITHIESQKQVSTMQPSQTLQNHSRPHEIHTANNQVQRWWMLQFILAYWWRLITNGPHKHQSNLSYQRHGIPRAGCCCAATEESGGVIAGAEGVENLIINRANYTRIRKQWSAHRLL